MITTLESCVISIVCSAFTRFDQNSDSILVCAFAIMRGSLRSVHFQVTSYPTYIHFNNIFLHVCVCLCKCMYVCYSMYVQHPRLHFRSNFDQLMFSMAQLDVVMFTVSAVNSKTIVFLLMEVAQPKTSVDNCFVLDECFQLVFFVLIDFDVHGGLGVGLRTPGVHGGKYICIHIVLWLKTPKDI